MAGASSSSSAAGKAAEEDLEEMLKHLDLQEDELDDVIGGGEEVQGFEKEARWLAIGRLNTDRSFSHAAMFETLKYIWGLAQTPKYREASKNLFVFQMCCLRDWKKVVHGGPWLFRGYGLIMEDYDGRTDPSTITVDDLYIWAQIHKVPDPYRHESMVYQLTRRIGKVREIQLAPTLLYDADYVWVCSRVLIGKPLTRFTPLTVEGEGRCLLMVKYEKIPYFCQVCGLMGHGHEECGDGVWEPKDKRWGTWMIAQPRTVQYALPSGGGRAPRGGRGRGPSRTGRGASVPRKRSSQEVDLNDS